MICVADLRESESESAESELAAAESDLGRPRRQKGQRGHSIASDPVETGTDGPPGWCESTVRAGEVLSRPAAPTGRGGSAPTTRDETDENQPRFSKLCCVKIIMMREKHKPPWIDRCPLCKQDARDKEHDKQQKYVGNK